MDCHAESEIKCRVVIYGASLFMAVLEAALQAQPGVTIARIDPTLPNASESVMALDPEVIVLDEETPSPFPDKCCSTLAKEEAESALMILDLKHFVLAKQSPPCHPIQDVAEFVDLVRMGRAYPMISI